MFKFKTSLKLASILMLTLLIVSCEKQNEIESEIHSELKIHRINFEDLKNKIGKTPVFIELEKSISSRDLSDVTIDFDEIIMITDDDYNHYTIKIINNNLNEDPNIFYNLILDENLVTNEVESFFYKYDPNEEWLADTSLPYSGKLQMLENEIFSLEDLGSRRGKNCVTGATAGWECNAGNAHTPSDYENGICVVGGNRYYIELQYGPCPEITNVILDDGYTSSNGGGNGGNSNQTIVLLPCDDTGGYGGSNGSNCESVEELFNPYLCEPLTDEQIDWIFANSENTDAAEEMLDQIISNIPSNECTNINFSNYEALLALRGENDEIIYPAFFDNSDSSPVTFSSVADFETALNSFTSEINTGNVQNSNGTYSTKFKFNFTSLTRLNIDIVQELESSSGNNPYTVSEVTSVLSGFVLGVDWAQTSDNYTVAGNIATINLVGRINYNLFVEDIGTVFVDFKRFQMKVNIETGQAISLIELD